MASNSEDPRSAAEGKFLSEVGTAAARKLRVLRTGPQGVWFGLGLFGLVGWSIAIPTVAGGLLGYWWDRRHPAAHSRTIALLVGGLVLGCVNAWRWVVGQDQLMHERKDGGK